MAGSGSVCRGVYPEWRPLQSYSQTLLSIPSVVTILKSLEFPGLCSADPLPSEPEAPPYKAAAMWRAFLRVTSLETALGDDIQIDYNVQSPPGVIWPMALPLQMIEGGNSFVLFHQSILSTCFL